MFRYTFLFILSVSLACLSQVPDSDRDYQENRNSTAVLEAALAGYSKEQLIDFILSNQAIVSDMSDSKHLNSAQELLREAILDDSEQGVAEAIRCGARVDEDIDEKSPLLWAVLLRNYHALNGLLKAGAKPNAMLLSCARGLGDARILIKLIKSSGMNFRLFDERRRMGEDLLFNELADVLDFEGILLYLQNGGYLPVDGGHQVFVLDQGSFGGFLTNLFTYYCNPGSLKLWGGRSIYIPENYRSIAEQIFHEIIKNGYDVDEMWRYAKAVDVVQLLLNNGANPNFIISLKNDKYTTPLGLAVANFDLRSVTFLIDAGADVNQKIDTGYDELNYRFITPHTVLASTMHLRGFYWNGYSERDAVIRFLLEHGARYEVDNGYNEKGFRAGTLVKTPNGYKRIETLKEGDLVVSDDKNQRDGTSSAQLNRPIIKIVKHRADSYVRVSWKDCVIDMGGEQPLRRFPNGNESLTPNRLLNWLERIKQDYPHRKDGHVVKAKLMHEDVDLYELRIGQFDRFIVTSQDLITGNY